MAFLIPIECSSPRNRMLWWIASKAALRSSRTGTETSQDKIISDFIKQGIQQFKNFRETVQAKED